MTFQSKKQSMEAAEIEEQSHHKSSDIQPRKKPHMEGKSRSVVHEQHQQEQFCVGQLNSPLCLLSFMQQIHKIDKNSVVLSPMCVWHICCGKFLLAGAPLKTSNHKEHIQTCSRTSKGSKLTSPGVVNTI
ncbi:hypothetical protein V5O48_018222, partial [Marasmius crinis-equi]